MYLNKQYKIPILTGVAQELKHLMTDLTEPEILTYLSYPLVDRPRHVNGLTGFDTHPHTQICFKKSDYKLHPELRYFGRIIKPYNAL